jgi:hypothetical protein
MLFGRKSEKVLGQIEQLEFQTEDLVVALAVDSNPKLLTLAAEHEAMLQKHRARHGFE